MNGLLAWLWQGVALTAVMWLAIAATRRLNAATRHLLWWATLLVVLLLPAVRWFALAGSATPGAGPPVPSGTPVLLPHPPDWTIAVALGTTLGIVGLRLGRVVRALVAVSRLKSTSTPLPEAAAARLPMWTAVRATGRQASLRTSRDVPTACALGFRRPAVVVSSIFVERLAPSTVDHIVVHEHAHLARGDDWTRALQAIVEALFGLHPAVWFIGRRIDFEREAACDDRVAAAAGSARRYARSLADAGSVVAARRQAPLHAALGPAAFRRPRALEARVARLLDERRDGRTHVVRGAALAFTALLATGLTVAHATGTVVSFAPLVAVERTVAAIAADTAVMAERAAAGAVVRAVTTDSVPRAPQVRRPVQSAPAVPPDSHGVESPAHADDTVLAPAREDVTEPAPLAATPLSGVHAAPTSVTPGAVSLERNPWSRVGDGGAAVGTGVGRAAGSVGGFFNRAGKAVGAAFTRAADK